MKALVKRVGKSLEEVEISDLKDMQEIVDGNIESIPLFHNISLICNGYGKIKNLEYNFTFKNDDIVGNVIFLKSTKEGFSSLDKHDINKLKRYFQKN